MGRPLRLSYPRALHHVTMRCNNKEFLFDPDSFRLFLNALDETRNKFRIALYNYCLMTNHVHLLFQVDRDDTLSRFMHRLANVFAKRFNAARKRKGHLWEARFLSTIVEPDSFFLRCMAYIDLNPVRAGMVQRPPDYPWSAHRCIKTENTAAIDLHEIYLTLGDNRTKRYAAYSKFLAGEAARKPFSLARSLFVGTPRFTGRLCKRFGIAPRNRFRYSTVELRPGLFAIDLRKGGRTPRMQSDSTTSLAPDTYG